jgi:outer membrane protein TolC
MSFSTQGPRALLSPSPVVFFAVRVAVIACTFALSFPVDAAGTALTLQDAQRRALERSRQLAAEDYAVASARDMAFAAGQLPDPVVRIGIDNLPLSGSERFTLTRDFMTMTRVGLMQELTGADKRRIRADRFEREADKALAQKLATATEIERDTAVAWLDRYYAEAIAAVLDEIGGQARLEIQSAEGAYRAGRGNQADIFAARSALTSFEDRASEAQRKVRNAKVMLTRWIGEAAELPLAGEPATNAIRVDPSALEKELAHHPQIAVLTKQQEVAEAEARIAQANKKSDWTVELAYQRRGSSYSDMISIGVSIPWQWDQKNRQDRELSSKLAMVEQARAARDEVLRTHIAETRAMINEWENGRERQARYQRELIPLASERIEATIAAYRGGKTGLSDVLAARRNEIDMRIQALQLAAETARLWAQINFLFPADAHNARPAGVIKGAPQ